MLNTMFFFMKLYEGKLHSYSLCSGV